MVPVCPGGPRVPQKLRSGATSAASGADSSQPTSNPFSRGAPSLPARSGAAEESAAQRPRRRGSRGLRGVRGPARPGPRRTGRSALPPPLDSRWPANKCPGRCPRRPPCSRASDAVGGMAPSRRAAHKLRSRPGPASDNATQAGGRSSPPTIVRGSHECGRSRVHLLPSCDAGRGELPRSRVSWHVSTPIRPRRPRRGADN